MASKIDVREVKKAILELIEEDREFRYTIMGLLGFKEILDRITRLEERQQKLEERFLELEKRFMKLEERQQRLEERQQRLEERQQKLEERMVKVEERLAKVEERLVKVEEALVALMREFNSLRKLVLTVAHRFGVITEESFREALRYVVEETLGVARVERWVYRDSEGLVYGYSTDVEVDVVVRDKEHILVEVKSRVSKGDVTLLYKKAKLYEKVRGVKPKLLIFGGFIDPEAYEAASKLGVEIKPVVKE